MKKLIIIATMFIVVACTAFAQKNQDNTIRISYDSLMNSSQYPLQDIPPVLTAFGNIVDISSQKMPVVASLKDIYFTVARFNDMTFVRGGFESEEL